ncbi:MAG: tail fiber protein [Pseudomonadota bacterium]
MKHLKYALVGAFLMQMAAVSAQARDMYLGEIFMFGGTFCPRGTAAAEGQLLAISEYSALFALLGTIYGGDGRTTFGLPDLRGRVPLGQGAGPGLPAYLMGQSGGTSLQSQGGGYLTVRYCVALEGIFPSRS